MGKFGGRRSDCWKWWGKFTKFACAEIFVVYSFGISSLYIIEITSIINFISNHRIILKIITLLSY